MTLNISIEQNMGIKLSNIKKFIYIFLAIDMILIGFTLFSDIFLVSFASSQIAFVSSLFITIGSYIGYQKNINLRLQNYQSQERDTIDDIDDPFDLYNEEKNQKENQKDIDNIDIKDIIQEEKNNLQKNSFQNLFKSLSGFSSLYRLAGYVFLVLGFFYLVNNGLFNYLWYLIGVSVSPIGIILSKFIKTNKVNDEGLA